jgi:hypothetical protein
MSGFMGGFMGGFRGESRSKDKREYEREQAGGVFCGWRWVLMDNFLIRVSGINGRNSLHGWAFF